MSNSFKRILFSILLVCALLPLLIAIMLALFGDDSAKNTSSAAVVGCMLVLLAIIINEERIKKIAVRRIQNKKKKGNKPNMKDFLAEYLDKECLVYTINGQLDGTVKAVSDGAIQLETKNGTQIVNLDYIVRLCEYPKNKKGKKKSVVID